MQDISRPVEYLNCSRQEILKWELDLNCDVLGINTATKRSRATLSPSDGHTNIHTLYECASSLKLGTQIHVFPPPCLDRLGISA